MSALVKACRLGAIVTVGLLCTQTALAERAILSSSLGQWLTKTAAPNLAHTLSKHPKFKGQQFKFVTLSQGQLAPAHNKLTQTIAQELQHHILRSGNNNIVTSVAPQICAQPESQAYLLGLQIIELGRNHHKFTLGVIDADDGVWVSGVSLVWEGRLLTSERAALGQLVTTTSPGTIDNPWPLTATTQIAQTLVQQFLCRTSALSHEEFFLVPSRQPQIRIIDQALLDALAITPTPLTDSKADATSHLFIDVKDGHIGVSKLTLVMQSGGLTQHLGQVFTSPGKARANKPKHNTVASIQPSRSLIAEVEHISNRRCAHNCAEIRVQLNEPAYLAVFHTHAGLLTPQSCNQPVKQASPGQLRFKVALQESTDHARQHTGVYVIATRDEVIGEQLSKHLQGAPTVCKSGQNAVQWREHLIAITEQRPRDIEWRTVHFTHKNKRDI